MPLLYFLWLVIRFIAIFLITCMLDNRIHSTTSDINAHAVFVHWNIILVKFLLFSRDCFERELWTMSVFYRGGSRRPLGRTKELILLGHLKLLSILRDRYLQSTILHQPSLCPWRRKIILLSHHLFFFLLYEIVNRLLSNFCRTLLVQLVCFHESTNVATLFLTEWAGLFHKLITWYWLLFLYNWL